MDSLFDIMFKKNLKVSKKLHFFTVMCYGVIFRELTKSEVANDFGFSQCILFTEKYRCKHRHVWQPRFCYPVPNRFCSLEGRPCSKIKKIASLHVTKLKLFLTDRMKNKARRGNSSGKEFPVASRSMFSHYRLAAMIHLDLAFASCRFRRTTGLDKARRLFVRFSSTVVERVLVSPAIRGLPPLPPPSTLRKQ